MNNVYKIYVDGSYNRHKKVGSYAFMVLSDNDETIYSESKTITNEKLLKGHQVGCECKAVVEALRWCIKQNAVCDIYYDFANLKYWVDDLWGNKPWKTNTEYSKAYRYYCVSNRKHLRNMIKVKSHTGNIHNEMVDIMCNSCY